MATKSDLELAKLLMSNRILDEAGVRQAFEQQGAWLRQNRIEPLPEVLYALDLLPRGSLDALEGPGPEHTQPFSTYRIEGVLGEGGMSTVYAATYVANGTQVALKVLRPIPALRGDFLERFQREGRLLTRLEHPGIVAGYELLHEGGYHFFSMDRVDGSTVLEVIERRGPLSSTEALSITLQVARALEYLHGQGLLHRDIKPGNIMVEASGRARLIDLGLVGRIKAGAADSAAQGGVEQAGMTVGTVEYLSPEQARGRTDLDARSDIYSLGVTLYHMVVGEVPFQGASDYEVMAKQIMTALDSAKVKQRRIAPEVHFLIAKMTAKDRDERFPAMKDVLRQIEGYLTEGLVLLDLGLAQRVEPAAGGRWQGADQVPVARPVSSASVPSAVPVARPVPPSVPTAVPVARPVSPAAPMARPAGPARVPARVPGGPPSAAPSAAPVARPPVPTVAPMARPAVPSVVPTVAPVARPAAPSVVPTVAPVARPATPSAVPTVAPVARPATPSAVPTVAPVARPVAPPPRAVPVATPVVKPVAPPPVAPRISPAPAPRAAPAAPPAAGASAAPPAGGETARPTKGQAPIPTKKLKPL